MASASRSIGGHKRPVRQSHKPTGAQRDSKRVWGPHCYDTSLFRESTMTRNRLLLAVLSVVILSIGHFTYAQNANVAGCWDLRETVHEQATTQTLTLEQNGTALSGALDDQTVTGEIIGESITLSGTCVTRSGKSKTKYVGTVSADTMKGESSCAGRSFQWTARRSMMPPWNW